MLDGSKANNSQITPMCLKRSYFHLTSLLPLHRGAERACCPRIYKRHTLPLLSRPLAPLRFIVTVSVSFLLILQLLMPFDIVLFSNLYPSSFSASDINDKP